MDFLQLYGMAILKLLGSLGLLIYGMRMMSGALQKLAGPQLRHVLGAMTTNRLTGMLTGIVVTAAIQSSTATTVMTVSFVSAELLTLAQAISIIMGANIGTTLTAWIMSAGFSLNVTDMVYPAFVIAIVLIYKRKNRYVGDFLFGGGFLFLGLGTLRQTGSDLNLGENEAVLQFFSSFDPHAFSTTLTFLLIGSVLTMMVQSSAAVMAITMILCSSGALPIYQGIALVMGENIGTTVTSNLTALSASTQARRAAFSHMLFNLFGVCWMLCVLHPFVDQIGHMVGYDPCMQRGVTDQQAFMENAAKLSIVLAAFHTCFNLINTGILIGFIPQIERIVCWVIRNGKERQKDDFHLQYISHSLMQTPELSVMQAQKETARMAQKVEDMFGNVCLLMEESGGKKFDERFEQIAHEEDTTDRMEIEIARYISKVSNEHLSDETKMKIRCMMRELSELESVGDACYQIARSFSRMQEQNRTFTHEQRELLQPLIGLCREALKQMNLTLKKGYDPEAMKEALRLENEINATFRKLKDQNIQALNSKAYDYGVGSTFGDVVQEMERLGDYVINVVQARMGQ